MSNPFAFIFRRARAHPPYISVPENAIWRLERCPQCGYELQGSPPTGICPECGGLYDCSRIVLHGYARRPFARICNMSVSHLFVQIPLSLLPVGFIYYSVFGTGFYGNNIASSIALVACGVWPAQLLLELLVRSTNGRPWLVRIDFTPRGMCQIDDFDPHASPYVVLSFARAIFVPAIIAGALMWHCLFRPSSAAHWIFLFIFIVITAIAAILWRGRRIIAQQAMVDPNLQRQVWIAWSELAQIHLEPKHKTGEYIIAASRSLSVPDKVGEERNNDAAHALVQISPHQIDALVRQITEWNPAIRITTTVHHREPEAENLQAIPLENRPI